jgi:hypothetical protein
VLDDVAMQIAEKLAYGDPFGIHMIELEEAEHAKAVIPYMEELDGVEIRNRWLTVDDTFCIEFVFVPTYKNTDIDDSDLPFDCGEPFEGFPCYEYKWIEWSWGKC